MSYKIEFWWLKKLNVCLAHHHLHFVLQTLTHLLYGRKILSINQMHRKYDTERSSLLIGNNLHIYIFFFMLNKQIIALINQFSAKEILCTKKSLNWISSDNLTSFGYKFATILQILLFHSLKSIIEFPLFAQCAVYRRWYT